MKDQFVSLLIEGTAVDSVFAMRSKELRSARTGEAYLTLELADRTGRMPAVMFRPPASAVAIPVGTVVGVRGTVTSWRGTRRVAVDSIRPTDGFDRTDLLPEGRRDRKELVRKLRSLVKGVRGPALASVLEAVFGDGDFMGRFLACPASQGYHHAHLGGLLEHTVAVAGMCENIVGTYHGADPDLLVCGALLHDIGKVDELAFDTSVEFTDEGRLLGHVVLGERRVRDAVARSGAGMSGQVLTQLSHIVLSHHGELEWGAPKRPATIEALILHHVDNLDAKIAGFAEAARGASLAEERWTDSHNLFRRPLWAPRAIEDDRGWPPIEDIAHLGASA